MREDVFTFALRDEEQERARGMAERYLLTNPETPVGHRTWMGNGGMEYAMDVVSVAPHPTNPEVTVYTWRVGGVARVSTIEVTERHWD